MNGWEYSITHPPLGYSKKNGSGGGFLIDHNANIDLPPMNAAPWHQSIIQPQWSFSGYRDHFSIYH